MLHAIGIDLGGTKTAVGIVSAAGRVLFSEEIPTRNRDGAAAILDATAAAVIEISRYAANLGLTIDGVGIGSAGVIDPVQGSVTSATDAIRGWTGTRLTEELAARLGLPAPAVRATNDVHAHALGEAWTGAAAGTTSSLLVAFGTGVGGSFVLNGAPVPGHRFVGGHVGHFASPFAVYAGEPLPCVCGGHGHVEAIASGPAILDHFRRLSGEPAADARAVFALASAGNEAAAVAVRAGASAAGQAVGGLSNILDPEKVVISGGLASAGPMWWEPMETALRAELLPALTALPVQRAELGNAAAVIGAASLILKDNPRSGMMQK